MMPQDLITYLAPFVVFLVTALIKIVKGIIPGWVITVLIVPLLSAATATIAASLGGADTWLLKFIFGLLAVFVNEFVKQIRQG